MGFARLGAFLVLGVLIGVGCASDEERSLRQLSRQQAVTIESLNAEVLKLNREFDGAIRSRGALKAALPDVEKLLAAEISRRDCSVSLEEEGLEITFYQKALFDPEEGRLLASAENSLSKIAGVLSSELSNHEVAVEGHTDNQPVEGPEGVTQWEYSVDCAGMVLRYFLDVKGLPPERFRVSGFGAFRPIASNGTAEGRGNNRRVVIVILP